MRAIFSCHKLLYFLTLFQKGYHWCVDAEEALDKDEEEVHDDTDEELNLVCLVF